MGDYEGEPSPVQTSGEAGPSNNYGTSIGGNASKDFEQRFSAGGIEKVKYAVIFEKSQTGYGAYVPDLPGCVAVGKTLKATQRLIREAIELHLQGMREDGDPIPEPSSIADYVTVSASQVASDD
jgi:predicted RNase H-like HicB family nuclease